MDYINVVRVIIHGSTRPCNCVVFTDDGDCFAAVSQDAGVRIFSSRTLGLMQQFLIQSAHRLSWTHDGEALFVATSVEGVFIVKPWTREIVRLGLPKDMENVEFIGLDEVHGRLVLVTHPSIQQQTVFNLSVLDIDYDQIARCADGDELPVSVAQSVLLKCTATSMVLSRSGERVFVGTQVGDVTVFETDSLDAGSWDLDRPPDGRGSIGREIKGLCLTADGSTLVVPCRNCNITLYSATSGKSMFKYDTQFAPNCVGIHPLQPQVKLYFYAGGQAAQDVTHTASGQEQFNVYFRDLVFNTALGSLPGPIGPVLTGSWDPTGTLLVVAAQDGVIYTWRFPKEIYQYRSQSDA